MTKSDSRLTREAIWLGLFHVTCQWCCILSSALVSVEVPFWFLTVFAISWEVLIFGQRVFVWCWSLYIAVVFDRSDVLSWTQSRTLAEKITVWSARSPVRSRETLPFPWWEYFRLSTFYRVNLSRVCTTFTASGVLAPRLMAIVIHTLQTPV